MTRPYAFTFWHAIDETPGYIDLCLASQRRNLADHFEHVHLDLDSAKEWVPEHELLWEMSVPDGHGRSVSVAGRRVALYSGMMRVALLHRHGGLWVDADTILFPQFGLLAELVDDYDLMLGESSGGEVSNSVLGGRPGSPALAAYWRMISDRIAAKQAAGEAGAKWGEYGFHMLRAALIESGADNAWVAPWGVFDTVDVHLDRPTFVPGARIEESLSPYALDLSIFNNATDADVRRRSAADLLSEETLFSAAYRVAMGEDECEHLGVRQPSQLRTLNRAHLIVRRMELADRRTADLEARRDTLRERLDGALARRDEMARRLETRTNQRDELRRRLRRRTERLEQTTTQLRRTTARLRARRAEVRRLRARIAELDRSFPRLRRLLRRVVR